MKEKIVEKGIEFITIAKNMWLYLKGDSLENHTDINFFRPLIKMCYYNDWEVENLLLTKPDLDYNFTFIILTMEEAKEDLFTNGFPQQQKNQSKHHKGQKH